MDEFSDFEAQIDDIRDAASEKALELIKAELSAAQNLFPDAIMEFHTGIDAPYIKVYPPLHDQTNIHDFDIEENGSLRDVADQQIMQDLRAHIARMSKIAVYLEDNFRRDLGYVTLDVEIDIEPEPKSFGM